MKATSRAYLRDLDRLVRSLFLDINNVIVSQIPRWVREEESTRDGIDDELPFLIEQLRQQYSSPGILFEYQAAARDAARRTQGVNSLQTQAQLRGLGIDIFRETPSLQRLLTRFTRQNVALIVTIPQQSLGNVERIVEDGVQRGRRAQDIARDITAVSTKEGAKPSELAKARNRAVTIAVDQTLTFSAQLSRSRQRANGISKFIWQTAGDARVRDLHEPRQGKEYTWESGAPGQDPFPGDGVRCRCSSEPVL